MHATSSSHAASEFDIGIDGGHDSEQSTSLATATVYAFVVDCWAVLLVLAS